MQEEKILGHHLVNSTQGWDEVDTSCLLFYGCQPTDLGRAFFTNWPEGQGFFDLTIDFLFGTFELSDPATAHPLPLILNWSALCQA